MWYCSQRYTFVSKLKVSNVLQNLQAFAGHVYISSDIFNHLSAFISIFSSHSNSFLWPRVGGIAMENKSKRVCIIVCRQPGYLLLKRWFCRYNHIPVPCMISSSRHHELSGKSLELLGGHWDRLVSAGPRDVTAVYSRLWTSSSSLTRIKSAFSVHSQQPGTQRGISFIYECVG